MANYKTVLGSRGGRRTFQITVGLAEGYGPDANIHTAEEVVSLMENHLKTKAANGQPYLAGSVTTGTVVYAWPEGPGKAGKRQRTPGDVLGRSVALVQRRPFGRRG